MTSAPSPASDLPALEARAADLWRKFKTFTAIGVGLLVLMGALSTRTVQHLFPDHFPNWASATLVIGLLGGSIVCLMAARVFLKMRNGLARQIAQRRGE